MKRKERRPARRPQRRPKRPAPKPNRPAPNPHRPAPNPNLEKSKRVSAAEFCISWKMSNCPTGWSSMSRFTCAPNLQEIRSEEHTSELQSHSDLVCRLLLEKKKVMVILI